MTWEREIEAMTVEDLVIRNGPHLLASQLKSECRRYRELVIRAAADRRALVARLTEDQRIGEAVRDAARAGRKTVRIADLSPQLAAPQP